MRIVVLYGGFSNERDVSFATGVMVAKSLRKNHDVALVDMFLGVSDKDTFDDLSKSKIDNNLLIVSDEIPDYLDLINRRVYKTNSIIGKNVLKICTQCDLVFLALHGDNGEDGKIQAALDLLGVPYTGSDYLASTLAMNKNLTKILVKSVGVRTPDWEYVFIKNEKYISEKIKSVTLPVVVKIPDSGSSVGVYIARNIDDLRKSLMINIGKNVIIEQFISGREVQMAFLKDRALPSIEIISNSDFYNYSSKYQKGIAKEITPANITSEQEKNMGEMLMKIVTSLNLYTYSRADFIIDNEGKIWFIEINSLPGMTSTSLVPQEALAANISFDELCEIIIQDGINRRVGLDKYIN